MIVVPMGALTMVEKIKAGVFPKEAQQWRDFAYVGQALPIQQTGSYGRVPYNGPDWPPELYSLMTMEPIHAHFEVVYREGVGNVTSLYWSEMQTVIEGLQSDLDAGKDVLWWWHWNQPHDIADDSPQDDKSPSFALFSWNLGMYCLGRVNGDQYGFKSVATAQKWIDAALLRDSQTAAKKGYELKRKIAGLGKYLKRVEASLRLSPKRVFKDGFLPPGTKENLVELMLKDEITEINRRLSIAATWE